MKFLINNYASEAQTESLYFNTSLNLIKGCSSNLWDARQYSAYDMFDLTKPDYFITHVSSIQQDALSYIKENKNCKIILNITGQSKENLENIEKFILNEGIEIAFFYTNEDETFKLRNTNIVSIPLGADIFLDQNNLRYNIKKAFVINSKSDIIDCEEPHHTLSYNSKLSSQVDISMPEIKLAGLYRNYQEVVIRFCGKLIPQLFFDACYYGNKVYYDVNDPDQMSTINSKIGKILKIDYSLKNNDNPQVIKNIIKKKHTCLSRVKSLLSQLPSGEIIHNVDEVMKVYFGDLS